MMMDEHQFFGWQNPQPIKLKRTADKQQTADHLFDSSEREKQQQQQTFFFVISHLEDDMVQCLIFLLE